MFSFRRLHVRLCYPHRRIHLGLLAMEPVSNPPPVVVILGSTGTGKTKLSLELARRFHGEIISADSMQVYKGLDIVTAKATKEEQNQAPHHLLDVATPEQAFTVVHFREKALPIVERLLAANRMPIIVGGTNYYIESILWKVLVSDGLHKERIRLRHSESDANEKEADYDNEPKRSKLERNDDDNITLSETVSELVQSLNSMKNVDHLESLDSSVLHQVLRVVDPTAADRMHPNNKRKIIRALEVLIETGGRRTLSEIITEQRAADGGSKLGGPLRYKNAVIFWLRCEQDTLNVRLDSRVDGMVAQGLLEEIRVFYEEYVKPYANHDYHRGILQSIGFKEFVRYLEKYDRNHDRDITTFMQRTDGNMETAPAGLNLLQECLDNLKMVTRRYSKRQLKWITNRFLGNSKRSVPPLYALDTTDPSRWDEHVYEPARTVLECLLEGTSCRTIQPLGKLVNPREQLNEETSFRCETCARTIVGEYQWQLHIKSNKHKKCLQSHHKRQRLSLKTIT